MLAGNLASIGVGAIVATMSSLIVCVISMQFSCSQLIFEAQWPANFDWESTRAINRPVLTVKETHEEKFDPDSDNKQADVSVTGGSVAGDSYHTSEDELDPVALNKAFKFAATSSVALVGF